MLGGETQDFIFFTIYNSIVRKFTPYYRKLNVESNGADHFVVSCFVLFTKKSLKVNIFVFTLFLVLVPKFMGASGTGTPL